MSLVNKYVDGVASEDSGAVSQDNYSPLEKTQNVDQKDKKKKKKSVSGMTPFQQTLMKNAGSSAEKSAIAGGALLGSILFPKKENK